MPLRIAFATNERNLIGIGEFNGIVIIPKNDRCAFIYGYETRSNLQIMVGQGIINMILSRNF